MKASSESGLWAQMISVLEGLGIGHRRLSHYSNKRIESADGGRVVVGLLLRDEVLELDTEALERGLESLEVRLHLAEIPAAALALQVLSCQESSACSEGGHRSFEAVGSALNALGVPRGNRAAQVH